MSKIYDEIFNEGKIKGIELGIEKGINLEIEKGINLGEEIGKLDTIKRLFNLGYSLEQVSEVYPEESMENLKKFQLEVLQPS